MDGKALGHDDEGCIKMDSVASSCLLQVICKSTRQSLTLEYV